MVGKDFSAQMDALKQLSTLLTKKEDVPAELWADAGMKVGARLKDVSGQIVKVKKLVSSQTREANKPDDDEDDDGKDGKYSSHRKDQREKKDVRKLGASKKAQELAMARGEFDMKTDHVYVDDGGDVRTAE